MAEKHLTAVAILLRQLRIDAGFSQEELAERAKVSQRTVSDIERGIIRHPRRDTVQLLAEALNLGGQALAEFEAACGRHLRADGPEASKADPDGRSRSSGDARAWLTRTVRTLDELGIAAARSVLTQWRDSASVDDAWLTWVGGLIELTAEGRMQPIADRPLPVIGSDPLFGRDDQIEELGAFVERVKKGRGGLALVTGPAGIGKSHLLGSYLSGRSNGILVEWATLDRDEAGYRGWRRLLAPMWINIRRTELPAPALLAHAQTLDDILLVSGDSEPTQFPRVVAAAVAALLDHVALRQAVVLVIDDAHRGGATSDQLMLDVARLVSACRVGIVAALRLDEIEQASPIRSYGDQAQDRAAMDVVVPIEVPPLDAEATACLLKQLTGRDPPHDVVDEVIKHSGGRPQLMKHTLVQAPARGAEIGDWTVGKLGSIGLRVLESTIQSRPPTVREVFYAAALCVQAGYVAPGFLARLTELPIDEVERILDAERHRDSMLTPNIPGYRFQHDNWIDALRNACPARRRHVLHARCLALLREEQAPDPHRLAWHAIGAGGEIVGEDVIGTLARKAADRSFADYAFGQAAELYAIAAQHSAGTDRIDLLIGQADALRFRGAWDQARDVLDAAVSLAKDLEAPGHEAKALIHLERLIWTYGLNEQQVTQHLRDVLERLRPDDAELRVQTLATLAFRLSIATRNYDDEPADLARSAREELSAVSEPLALADCLLGIRGGLQDTVAPQELLGYSEQILSLGMKLRSGYHINEALSLRIIDLIRCGRLGDLSAAVRDQRVFGEQSAAPVAIYSQALIQGMLALARGEFKAATEHTATAGSLCSAWGESMAGEALMAQVGWLLYETGELDGLADFLVSLPSQDVSSLNGPLWSLGAGLIYAEQGDVDSAIHRLMQVCEGTRDLANLPRGPSRISILATAAMVLGHPLVIDALPGNEAIRIGGTLAQLLTDHQDALVLAGWPAVILGSKHRFIGLAELAAARPASAAGHLERAARENKDLKVLHARTLFDLARALLRVPHTRALGIAEMERAKQLADDLKMKTLAAQALAAQPARPRRLP